MYAQEHLSFKNIPIDGDIQDFSKELESAGFVQNDEKSTTTYKWFNGDFMGKSSEVMVPFTPKGLVFKVIVLHEYQSWSSLSSAFEDATELYTKKYGEPTDKFKFFSKPYYKGDGYELQAIRNDKCHYFYAWKVEHGYISVRLNNIGHDYYVQFVYEDTINQDLRDKEKEVKAYDDI